MQSTVLLTMQVENVDESSAYPGVRESGDASDDVGHFAVFFREVSPEVEDDGASADGERDAYCDYLDHLDGDCGDPSGYDHGRHGISINHDAAEDGVRVHAGYLVIR